MRKFIVHSFLFLFFCIFLGTNHINGGEVDKNLHIKCLYPTIYVGHADKSGYGSGVIVRSEKIDTHHYRNVFITCAHLVTDSEYDYEVRQYIYDNWSQIKDTKSYSAAFVAYNHDMDIAIGVFKSEMEMPTATLDFEPSIFIGNDVYRIGCGLGDDPRLDYGKLTSYRRGSKPYFRTSVMTVPGDSGSPLFHENKVIGITVSIRSYRNLPVFNISFAVPLERFKMWNEANTSNLSFAWDKTKKLPEMQFRYLNFMDYEMK